MIKILIWGTGNIARQVLENGMNGQIIGFIETHKSKNMYMDKIVYSIDEIPNEYDFIVIANTFVDEIYRACRERNISLDKMIFLKGIKRQEGYSDIKVIREILGEKNSIDYYNEYNYDLSIFLRDDINRYNEMNTRKTFEIHEENIWPILWDKFLPAGVIGNYFWQDLWAARQAIKSGLKPHFDIGSKLDGFIAHLLASEIDVTIIDIREFPSEIEHLHTIVDDATSLHQIPDGSIESMSALCSLEHFGLGRYGDSIDSEACFKCFYNIQRKLKKGGKLYVSVPIGKERVEFNAHRVFYARTVKQCFSSLKLVEFSCVAEGRIEYNVDISKYDNDSHDGEYRYGLFAFVK